MSEGVRENLLRCRVILQGPAANNLSLNQIAGGDGSGGAFGNRLTAGLVGAHGGRAK